MQVNPYLFYNGNCEAALKFYQKVLGAEIEAMLTYDGGPADMPIPPEAAVDGVIWLPRLLVALGWASSNGEARRLVTQGGVRLDGEAIMYPDHEAPEGAYRGKVLQVGRRWFGRLA